MSNKNMLRNLVFVLMRESDPQTQELMREELSDAAQILGQEGIRCIVRWFAESGAEVKPDEEDTLYLVNDSRIARLLQENGIPSAGYSYEGRTGSLRGLPFIVEDPGWVSPDSFQKIRERLYHLPWKVLETEHCIVREFTPEDAAAVLSLYDVEARRYLPAPPDTVSDAAQILEAYVRNVYSLYGFGYWAVEDREDKELIGRAGFALPTSGENRQCRCDVTFGYLIRRDRRGRGLAREVCEALLAYGFAQLGFRRIRADAAPDNIASIAVLEGLGFRRVKEISDMYIYMKEEEHDQ